MCREKALISWLSPPSRAVFRHSNPIMSGTSGLNAPSVWNELAAFVTEKRAPRVTSLPVSRTS